MPDTLHQAATLDNRERHENWGEDFAQVSTRINRADNGDAVWDIIGEVCDEYEMIGACCRCFPSGASAEPIIFFSRTSEFSGDLEGAIQNTPSHLDAFLHASVRSPRPFHWEEVAQLLDPKSAQVDTFEKDIAPLGEGVVVPVFGPLFRNGYFCFHGALDREYSETEMLMLHSVSQTAYLKLCDLMYRSDQEAKALSTREIEIINLIARGKSSQVAAEELDVSVNTINTHLKRLFEKLDVTDRVSAVMRAYALGLIH